MYIKETEGMKSIAIDFTNSVICFMTDGQQGTEVLLGVSKKELKEYIPRKYYEQNSFTWNFINNTVSINQEYTPLDNEVITQDCFIPKKILPFPNLNKKYEEFLAVIGYQQIPMEEFLGELPRELRKLLGLDYGE